MNLRLESPMMMTSLSKITSWPISMMWEKLPVASTVRVEWTFGSVNLVTMASIRLAGSGRASWSSWASEMSPLVLGLLLARSSAWVRVISSGRTSKWDRSCDWRSSLIESSDWISW